MGGGLPDTEIYVSSVLLSISGLSIVFLAIMQTAVSVCQAVGKPYASVIIISFAIVVKALVNLFTLPNAKINIYGAALSETLCYLFATVYVIIYLKRKVGLKLNVNQCVIKPLASGMLMTLCITVAVLFTGGTFNSSWGTLVLIALSGVIYFAGIFAFKVFDRSELAFLPIKQK